jgi:hypothetical protein
MALECGQQGRSAAGDPLVLPVGPVAGTVRHSGGDGRERAACFCVLQTSSSSRAPRAAASGHCHTDCSATCERLGAAAAARRGAARAGRCCRAVWRMQAGGARGAGAGGEQPQADRGGDKISAAAPLPINPLMRRAMLIRALGANKTREAPPDPQNVPPAWPAPAPKVAKPREVTVPAPAPPRPSATVADQTADTWSPSGIASGTSEGSPAPGAAQARSRRGRPPKKNITTAAGLAGGATPAVKPTTKARPKAKAKKAASPPSPAVRATQGDEGSSAPKRGRGRPPRAVKAREEQRGLDRLGVTSRRERTARFSGGADGPDGQKSDEGSRNIPPAGASQKSPLYQIQKDIPQWVKVRAAKQDSESAALRNVLVKKADPVGIGAPGGTVIDVEDLDYLPAFEDVRAPPQAAHANASTISPLSAARRKLLKVTVSPSAR